jgi:PKHD-type hydroxylase
MKELHEVLATELMCDGEPKTGALQRRSSCSVLDEPSFMKKHKRNKSSAKAPIPSPSTAGRWIPSAGTGMLEPQKDQTRLAAIQTVFTPEECLQLIAYFTPHLKPASVEAMDPAQSASIRKSSAVFVFPDESTNWVFERLGKAIREINDAVYGFDVRQFTEGFQFTRYEVGEYYGPHFDIGPGKLAERKLSLTVQLSAPDQYTGGELVIFPEFVAPKDQGSMTVFPSFMCHNVCPVKTGVRYSLVSWLAGPPFK